MKQKQDLFKVIELRKRRRNLNSLKLVALPVSSSTYDDYKTIKMKPNQSNRRIQHLSTTYYENPVKETPTVQAQKETWERHLDGYIKAKSKIQAREKSLEETPFYNLDRRNKNRLQKLIEKQFSTSKSVKSMNFHQRYSRDDKDPHSKEDLKIRIERKESKPRIKSDRMLMTMLENEIERQMQQKRTSELKFNFNLNHNRLKSRSLRGSLIQHYNAKVIENSCLIKSCMINTRRL